MTSAKGMHPGTIWRKADLQCHTPRDLGWQGSPALPGGTPAYEAARETWAAEYIAACKAAGLSMVAITDHHDICLAEYVRVTAEADDEFLFFPGIEITCSDNAQCLLIMDPSCGVEFQGKVLGTLTNVQAAAKDAPQTCAIKGIGETVATLYANVLKDDLLREKCLVFPHFSNEDNSHKSLNEVGHSHRFAALGCDGIYIERQASALDQVTLQKIRGEIPDWGKRRRAIIPTGDNRRASWERLGAHTCWIKIGEPTIEGLRQALLADEARVAHGDPEEPADKLVSITIRSTISGPAPLSMKFNPGFNAVIGGRGAGKSAILEYLRFGLGRRSKDLTLGEAAKRNERSDTLITDTLASGGYVEIELVRDGILETWKRQLGEDQLITVTDAAGSTSSMTLSDAQQKFPARAFDQKGLSSTMTDPKSAADQITGIAAAEEVEQRRQIEADIDTAQRAVASAVQQVVTYWQRKLDAQRKGSTAKDTKTRADVLAEKLKTEGVSQGALDIIDQAPAYAAGASYIQSIETGIATARQALNTLSPRILSEAGDAPLPTDLDVIRDLRAKGAEARLRIQQKLQECLAEINAFEAAKNASKTDFGAKRSAYKERYDEAVAEQEKHSEIIAENARLQLAVEETRKAQVTAEQEAADANTAQIVLATSRKSLRDKLVERYNILHVAAAKVAGQSSQTLKAKVKMDPAPEEYMKAFGKILEGSRISDPKDKCETWISELIAADPDGAWTSVCNQILDLYQQKIMSGSPPDPGQALAQKIQNFIFGSAPITDGAARRIYANLDDASVGDILAASKRDFIVLSYVDANGRTINFERASEGQQASALLELLLRQEAGTLIIDQPEDDLDNNVVMRVVELIRTSKSKRQLVFATHNPNIVVNGDADKIIALASTQVDPRPGHDEVRIEIETDGAIETPDVKTAITHIMEGGEQAFDLRRRKYRFGVEAS